VDRDGGNRRSWSRAARAIGARLLTLAVALLAALALCELGARLLLPRRQVVEVAPVPPAAVAGGPVRDAEQTGGIDVLLDWSGPRGLRLHPNVRAVIREHRLSGRDVVIETNGLGLRHPPLGPAPPDRSRVLVLGDSITFADYAPLEETFPGQLERLLRAADRDVTVVNGGLPGASTIDELAFYLEIRDEVRPDVVVLAMYLNDAQNSSRFYAREVAPWLEWSRFAGWAVGRIDLLRGRLTVEASNPEIDPGWREQLRAGRELKPGDMLRDPAAVDFEIYNASNDFGLAWNDAAWESLERLVAAFAHETDRRGERFGVLLLPVHFQVLGTVDNRVPQRRFAAMCNRLDLACLDLLPAMGAAAAGGQDLFLDHCHLTSAGNRVVAEAIAGWMPAADLLP